MSSLSTILNHFPSCGPTQTQGSLWGAGKVHFLSRGSQSGPMPACTTAASASSHFMLLLQLVVSQRRRGVAREAARPSVGSQSWSLLARRHASNRKPSVGTPVARARCGCSLRQRCGLFVSTAKIFLGAASVFMPLASSVALAFLALCCPTSPTNWLLVPALHLAQPSAAAGSVRSRRVP